MTSPGRKRKYEPVAICSAIQASHGIVVQAAYRLGCHPDTIYEAAKRDPDVAETLRLTREEALDAAESALFRAIEKGEQWAITFYLSNSREGAARGYSTRTKLGSAPDQPVNVTINLNHVGDRTPLACMDDPLVSEQTELSSAGGA